VTGFRGVTVGVVDYGAGNLRSIGNAFDHLAVAVKRVEGASELAGISHVVLPGVGAFGFCAARLRASGMLPALEQWSLADGKPLLGICVGMQLLADFSEELGTQQGLGWGGGSVLALDPVAGVARVPHVGWNSVAFIEDCGEFRSGEGADFYFDHSFAYQDPSRATVVATCTHGRAFAAIIRRGNILAAQFHPEKSQSSGMRFLRSFLEPGEHA
jgi:glutamine amidotransferase